MEKKLGFFIVLIVCAINFSPIIGEAKTYEHWTYTVLDDESIRLDKYTGNELNVMIPETIESKKVCGIGSWVFLNNKDIKEITISKYVDFIDIRFVSSCEKLEYIHVDETSQYYYDVNGILIDKRTEEIVECPIAHDITSDDIPQNVKSIGRYAFVNCSKLTKLAIPDNITKIDSNVFSGCNNLEEISLSKNITKIQSQTFFGCKKLSHVKINGNLISIEDLAFGSCKSLEFIDLPDTLKIIGENVFNKSGLKEIVLPDGLVEMGKGTFSECEALETAILPADLSYIEDRTFWKCISLKNVVFPNVNTVIGENCFTECISLISIILPKNLQKIAYTQGDDNKPIFEGCKNLEEINVESGNKYFSSDKGVLFNKDKSQLLVCPSGKRGYYTVPNSVRKIGYGAFFDCVNLYVIELKSKIKKIENPNCFISIDDEYKKSKLTSLYVSKNSYSDKYLKKKGFKYNYCTYIKSFQRKSTSVRLKWNKHKYALKYEIKVSQKSDMNNYKIYEAGKLSTAKTIKKLKKGKKYYVKIRVVFKDFTSGKHKYSTWSGKKQI